jgi:hypothetical protein
VQQQIPFGDDNKKSNGKSKDEIQGSVTPFRMTTKTDNGKQATTKTDNGKNRQRQRQATTKTGNDKDRQRQRQATTKNNGEEQRRAKAKQKDGVS